jgi:acyl-CoA reductase-like NAD-dependent aldehyde dehydrogenase
MADDDSIYVDVLKTLRELADGFRTLRSEFLAHRQGVDATIAAMRKDFHATTQSMQIDASQHVDEHLVERQERAADLIVRQERQTVVDGQLQRIQDGQESIRHWQWVRLIVEGICAGLLIVIVVVCVMLVVLGKVRLM